MYKELFKQYAESGKIYFNASSTTQKPTEVITEVVKYVSSVSSSPQRGNDAISSTNTKIIEDTRSKVSKFIGAKDSEIFFTSGATEGVRNVAYIWGMQNLKDGDEILFNPLDHDSLINPWKEIANILSKNNIKISLIPYSTYEHSGDPIMQDIVKKITPRTKLILISHIHHIFGLDAEISYLTGKLNAHTKVLLDCSQSVGHIKIDVRNMPVDFVVFSGHKMFSFEGIGVLWIRQDINNSLTPSIYETGTPNTLGILSLGVAIDFINQITIDRIQNYLNDLSMHLIGRLREVDNIEFLPGPAFCDNKCAPGFGIVSFKIKKINAQDIASFLSEENIMVRTGNYCMQKVTSIQDSIRISLHIYNTKDEIDKFIETLKSINHYSSVVSH